MTHLITSREFARDLKSAKQAAAKGPVLITTRGKPEFALLTYHDFEELSRDKLPAQSLWQAMSELPATDDVKFEPPRLDLKLRTPDFDEGEASR
jgi:hypothetical protein